MIIRQEQMDVLKQYVFNSFIARMLVRLRITHPELTGAMSNAELTAFVHASIRKAQMFDVRTEDNLQFFLDFNIICGLDCFDTPSFQWAREVLQNHEIDETEKMNRLSEYLVFGAATPPPR